MISVSSGDPIYVASNDVAVAMSLGARFVEGDSRLRIPSPLPDGVSLQAFERWATPEAKVIWLSEFLGMVAGAEADLLDVAGIISQIEGGSGREADVVSLYVPRSDMNRVGLIPGVRWSRNLGMYVADSSADFSLVHPYLTPRMKAIWKADRNLTAEIDSLVKARALFSKREVYGPEGVPELELSPPEQREKDEED